MYNLHSFDAILLFLDIFWLKMLKLNKTEICELFQLRTERKDVLNGNISYKRTT